MNEEMQRKLKELMEQLNGGKPLDENELQAFNADQVFEERVHPLLLEAAKICKQNGIPFIFTMTVASDEGDRFTQATMIGLSANRTPHVMLRVAKYLDDQQGERQDYHVLDENGNEVDPDSL